LGKVFSFESFVNVGFGGCMAGGGSLGKALLYLYIHHVHERKKRALKRKKNEPLCFMVLKKAIQGHIMGHDLYRRNIQKKSM